MCRTFLLWLKPFMFFLWMWLNNEDGTSVPSGCLTPAFQYYSQTVINDLVVAHSIRVFKAAQIINPLFVKISRPSDVDINRLDAIPFLDNNVIQSLKDELPVYLMVSILVRKCECLAINRTMPSKQPWCLESMVISVKYERFQMVLSQVVSC